MGMESPAPTYSDDSAALLIRAASITHLLSSKAQWDKTKPKGRCECHACHEREGQGQNCSYVHGHGNHTSSTMFGAGRRKAVPYVVTTVIAGEMELFPAP